MTSSTRTRKTTNLRENIKIMDKDYHLVNLKSKKTITIHPPSLPGMNSDGKSPKDEQGRWIRVCKMVDSNHQPEFMRQRRVVLTHLPGEKAYCMMGSQKWEIAAIEGVHAEKARGKARKQRRVRVQVEQRSTRKQKGPGRPKGSTNKPKTKRAPKVVEQVPAEVATA